MKNIIIILVVWVLNYSSIGAQPNWHIVASAYNNVMNVNATLTGPCGTSNDLLAAFDSNDQIRGVSQANNGDNEFFMTVRSNLTKNETLHFKYYDSESDSIFNLTDQTFTFIKDSFLGAPDPIEVSSPESVLPIALCLDFNLFLNSSGSASITIDDVDAGSSDNCNTITRSIDVNSFDCSAIGLQLVTLTITDASQNESACVANVTVLDTISPIINCKDIEVFLDATGDAQITPIAVNDNIVDNCTLLPLSLDIDEFDCSNLGTNTVTLTGKDNSSNVSNCNANVIVKDTISPNALCKNTTLYLDNNGSATLLLSDADNGSRDNCTVDSRSLSKTKFSCVDLGIQTIELTIFDVTNNFSICESTITILDTITPSVSCINPTIYLDQNGSANISIIDIDKNSSDNCNTLVKELSKTSFSCSEKGSNLVTLTAMDASENIGHCNSSIMVLDTIKPKVFCKNIEMFLNISGIVQITPSDINNNSNDNCTLLPLRLDKEQFDCSDIGSNVVTLTGEDNSSNISTCIANVVIRDTINPIALCKAATLYLDGNGSVNLYLSDVDNGSIDNCTIESKKLSETSFSCLNIGTQSIELTITDDSNNISNCESWITVLDTISPSASCVNSNIYLNENGNALLRISDIDNGSSDNCNTLIKELSQNSFNCSEIGSRDVILNVRDISGNSNSCTSTIIVLDTIKPTIVCKNIVVFLNASGIAQITPEDINNSSSDNCTLLPLSINTNQFDCSKLGTNMVTLTGIDNSTNTNSCIANVTVRDTLSPDPNCNNIEIQLDVNGQASISTAEVNNGSTDNCSIKSITLSKTSFNCSNIGISSVILRVTDNSNNISSCTSEITVIDNIAPIASCKDLDLTLSSVGSTTISATDIDNGSSDNCSVVSMMISKSNFNCTDIGTNNVTLEITDGIGNISSCSAIVTIKDTIKPVVHQKDTTIMLDASGSANLNASNLIGNLANLDACTNNPLVTMDMTAFTCDNIGNNTVTIEVSDLSGNMTTTTSVITVKDTIKPTANSKDKTLYLNASGLINITPSEIIESQYDNCGITSITLNKEEFSCNDIGENSVILTLMDNAGNTIEKPHTITVLDTIKPSVSCINLTRSLDVHGQLTITPTDISQNRQDACDNLEVNISRSQFSCSDIGINPITVTVSDRSGNTNSCIAAVEIIDPSNIAKKELQDDFVKGPTMLCPGNNDILFTSSTNDIKGTISWSYTGTGVTITPSATTLDCTIDLSSEATAGNLIATFQSSCQNKTYSIPISLSDPLRCSLYSNCAFLIYMTARDLERIDRPDIIQSQSQISVEGSVSGPMLYFKAGESAEFRNNFEILAGSNVEVSIEECVR